MSVDSKDPLIMIIVISYNELDDCLRLNIYINLVRHAPSATHSNHRFCLPIMIHLFIRR